MRAADIIVHTLVELGTKYIFSLSGNQIMPLYDACIDADIEIIHVRHEAAAVHMADAWGRLTGQPGVALLAAGPGFANSLSATYVARMAESPLVVLSGHAALADTGRSAFQALDQTALAEPVAKAAWLCKEAATMGNDIRQAFALAQAGRPGPVHLSLPFDLLKQTVVPAGPQPTPAPKPSWPKGFPTLVKEALANSQRPLILAGPALRRTPEFQTASPRLAAAHLPLIGMASPRGVNDPFLGRFATVLAEADLLILLNQKLDFTLKMGAAPFIKAGTKLLQLDSDADILSLSRKNGARLEILALAQGDPALLLEVLSKNLPPELSRPDWAREVAAALAYQPPEWAKIQSPAGAPLHPVAVGRTLNAYLAGAPDSVFVCDGGEFGQWMQALVRAPHRLINGKSGAIGAALPFAVAAGLAFPESRIVACSGDGAIGFQFMEFETAVRHNVPLTLLIGNDGLWNAEFQIQLREYGPERVSDVALADIDYHKLVVDLRGWGVRVSDEGALAEALAAAGASGLPACVNAIIRPEAAPLHPISAV